MVLSPAEMMAQHGSRPNWLIALPGNRTTTNSAAHNPHASFFRERFRMRVNSLFFMMMFLLRVSPYLLHMQLESSSVVSASFQERVVVSEFRGLETKLRCQQLCQMGFILKIGDLCLRRQNRSRTRGRAARLEFHHVGKVKHLTAGLV